VEATINLYENVSNTFRPKPSTVHYVYNLRDVTRVFLGISLGEKVGMFSPEQVIKLWTHESERVFADRLLESDLPAIGVMVTDVLKKTFNQA